MTSPTELASLHDHFRRCKAGRGSLFGLKCVGEAVDRFIAPRLFTTMVLLVAALTLASAATSALL